MLVTACHEPHYDATSQHTMLLMLLPSLYYCQYCTAPQPTSLKHIPSQLHHSLYHTTLNHHASCIISTPCYITLYLHYTTLHYLHYCSTVHHTMLHHGALYIMKHCTSCSTMHHTMLHHITSLHHTALLASLLHCASHRTLQ